MKQAIVLRRLALFTAMLMSGGGLYLPRPALLLVFFLLLALLPGRPLLRIHRALLPAILFVGFIMAIEFARPDFAISAFISRTGFFMAGIYVANTYIFAGRASFIEDFSAIVNWFPAQAIITVVLATLLPFLFVPFGDPDMRLRTFVMLFHFHVPAIESGLIRPNGFFWEPGILQFYLNLGLFLALRQQRKPLLIGSFILAILLTQSTTGVVILAGQLAIFTFSQFGGARWSSKKVVAVLVMALLLVPVGHYVYRNVEAKVSGELQGSFLARNYDAIAGLTIAANNPWIGIGFNHERYQSIVRGFDIIVGDYEQDVFSERAGATNGVVMLFYMLGFPLGTIMLIALIRQTAFPSDFVVPGMIFLSVLTEPLTVTPFLVFLMVSSLARFKRKTVVHAEQGMVA